MRKISLYLCFSLLLLGACGRENNPEPIDNTFFGEADGSTATSCTFQISDWEGSYIVTDPDHPFDRSSYTVFLKFKIRVGNRYAFTVEDFGNYSFFNGRSNIDIKLDANSETITLDTQSLNTQLNRRTLQVTNNQPGTFAQCTQGAFQLNIRTFHNGGFSRQHTASFVKR